MADKVLVNGMAAIHKGSAGQALAFPDVCLCPPTPPAGPIPTPLPNAVKAADLDGGAASVLIDGNPAGKLSSFLKQSTGNEVAKSTGGGVITHTVQGQAHFVNGSPNVFFEGEPAVRHLDMLTHNHLAPQPGNTPPSVWLSTMRPPLPSAPPGGRRKKLEEGTSWVTLRVVDDRGQPTRRAHYELTTPKGGKIAGTLAGKSKATALGISAGSSKLTLPEVDEAFQGRKVKGLEQPPAGCKAYAPGVALSLEGGKEHVVSVPGRDLWIEFRGRLKAGRSNDEDFVLRADDGSYELVRTLADHLEHGTDGAVLRFPCVVAGPTYTLVHRRGGEPIQEVFAERTFEQLFPAKGSGGPAVPPRVASPSAAQRPARELSPESRRDLAGVRAARLARRAMEEPEANDPLGVEDVDP